MNYYYCYCLAKLYLIFPLLSETKMLKIHFLSFAVGQLSVMSRALISWVVMDGEKALLDISKATGILIKIVKMSLK